MASHLAATHLLPKLTSLPRHKSNLSINPQTRVAIIHNHLGMVKVRETQDIR